MIGKALCAVLIAGVAISGASAQTRARGGYKEPGVGTLIGGRQTSAATRTAGANGQTDQIAIQPSADTIALGRKTARCLARTESKRSARFVLAGMDVPAQAVYGPIQAMMENCLGKGSDDAVGAAQFSRRSLQGLLAEALLVQGPLLNLAPLAVDQIVYSKDLAAESDSNRVVDAMATCLAYTQPAKAEALVRTEFLSPAEKAAFQDMMPALQGCLNRDTTLQANKAGIRTATALALFRRANEAAPAAASAEKK